jgi:hypothetical protein
MSDHPSDIVWGATASIFGVLATAAVEGHRRAQANADASATQDAIDRWYALVEQQRTIIRRQAAIIAAHEESILCLRADLETARLR